MQIDSVNRPSGKWSVGFFVLVQVSVMLFAISNESLWIDEFWTAAFVLKDNLQGMIEQISNPQIALTPLHYLYFYFWGIFFHSGEMIMRLANLPLFVLGQVALFMALRAYPQRFALLLLALSALHPMVWQYANEARPYMMMYAGAEMILAYLLHIHTIQSREDEIPPIFSVFFVLGSMLLFGASMLGGFWVFASLAYVIYFHFRYLNAGYLKHWVNLLLLSILLFTLALLGFIYLRSVLQGGSASLLSDTTVATVLFDMYELLGLSGIGPGRIELREAGMAALSPYWFILLFSVVAVSVILLSGLQRAAKLLGITKVLFAAMICLLPVVIVIFSGFFMHWRVLGRHLIASLPVINLIFAYGLFSLFSRSGERSWSFKRGIALSFLVLIIYSSFAMRFADRHRKDDYRGVAAVARQEILQGKQVWWAAHDFGAGYYGLIDFNREAIFTTPANSALKFGNSALEKADCSGDRSGFQLVTNASRKCLESFSPPDVVILSKPETFDNKGNIAGYLNTHGYVKVQTFPAFTIWKPKYVANPHGFSELQGAHS